jgi:hypothetical protein
MRAGHLSFVRPRRRLSSAPTVDFVRRRAQKLSRSAVAPPGRAHSDVSRPRLDSFEHGGMLDRIGAGGSPESAPGLGGGRCVSFCRRSILQNVSVCSLPLSGPCLQAVRSRSDLLRRNLRARSPTRPTKGSSATLSGNSARSRHACRPKSPLSGQRAMRDGSWSG